MQIGADTKLVLLAAGLTFIWALLLGILKYRGMAKSPEGRAHPYIDTAHRAALLYSFALLLVATFVELDCWSDVASLIAAGVLLFFFWGAIFGYMVQGLRGKTDNQFREGDEPRGLHPYMYVLILSEVGAFAFLLIGFVNAQLLGGQ
jgi:uncharacterized membrane protein YgdD (TMEM256/DUF423 family)